MASVEIIPDNTQLCNTSTSNTRDNNSPEYNNVSTNIELTEDMIKEEQSLQQETDKNIDRVSASVSVYQFIQLLCDWRVEL